MTVVNYTQARNNLKVILDSVVDNADYTIISRRDTDDAVVMSLDSFNALQETLHLLKYPKNVRHLEKSIAQYHHSQTQSHALLDV
jgi:antitoxin YefM